MGQRKIIIPDLPPEEERLEAAAEEYQKQFNAYEAAENADGTPPNPTAEPSVRGIAASFYLSYKTLTRRISGGKSRKEAHQHRQRLTEAEEKALVRWITHLAAWGFHPRVNQLMFMAEELLLKKGDTKPLGKNWVEKFKARHTDIASKFCAVRDRERYAMDDPEILSAWFQLFEKTMEENQILAEDLYNMDEKGFALGVQGSLRVMCPKKEKPVVVQDGNRTWVSIIEGVSAAGALLPPLIIFKAKMLQNSWEEAMTKTECNGVITFSDNGWTNNELGFLWFEKIFEPYTRQRMKGKKRMIILDGHGSHLSSDVIQFCIDHEIIPLCFPPHTTHHLQPLDVGLFQPLSTKYKVNLQAATRNSYGYTVNKPEFIEIFAQSRREALTPTNITSAWRKAGLIPLDPSIVLDKLARPATPPENSATATTDITIKATPAQAMQIQAIVDRLQGTCDPTLLKQLQRGACAALARAEVLALQNRDYMEAERKKVQKAGRKKGFQVGKVLDLTIIQARQQEKAEKDLAAIIKQLHRLGPRLVFEAAPTRSRIKWLKSLEKSPNKSPIKPATTNSPTKSPTKALPPMTLHLPLLPHKASALKASPLKASPLKASPKRPRKKAAGAAKGAAEKGAAETAETAEIRPIPLKFSTRSGRMIKASSKAYSA